MKILYVLKNMRLANGVSTYAINYYRKLHLKTSKFDFLILNDVGSPYFEEIKENGDRVFLAPEIINGPQKYFEYLNHLITADNYDIVHCHVVNSGALIMNIARKNKVKVRVVHSHATQNGDSFLKRLRNIPFREIALTNANQYIACSNLAGKSLFGRRKFRVVRNAMTISDFKYDFKLRKKLRFDDELIVGTVGRFTEQKNPFFIVDIIAELTKVSENFIFWWFGDGQLFDKVKKYAKKRGNKVYKHIVFWGPQEHLQKYYSAMDCFILPSKFEGLPVVGVEAQFSGLPTIFSDKVTDEAKISDNVRFLTLNDASKWASLIMEMASWNRDENITTVKYGDYDINSQSANLLHMYHKMLEE